MGPRKRCRLLRTSLDRTPTQPFQSRPRLFVNAVADPARVFLAVLDRRQIGGELARAQFRDLLTGGAANRSVRRNEDYPLTVAMLGRQPLEQRVGMGHEADVERTVAFVRADTVEDDDAAGAPQGDVAREQINELSPVLDPRGVEDVVAVEQVQRAIRQGASEPRRAAPQPRR